MMATRKKEFGDFQTPIKLAWQVCHLLSEQGVQPAAVVEPTCGQGSFVLASLEVFPHVQRVLGIDLNPNHLQMLKQELQRRNSTAKAEIRRADFFEVEWETTLAELPEPLLIIGNPPWVTNSTLGVLNSQNLPEKTNFQNHAGLDALTGKSNFDISEWMLLHLIQNLRGRTGVVAMLVKTSVARKVLKYVWENELDIGPSHFYLVDAKQEFGVSVEMCLFVCHTTSNGQNQSCQVHQGLCEEAVVTTFGFSDGHLVTNMENYQRWKHLIAAHEAPYQWRSGLKHDAVKVMELTKYPTFYQNNLGETCVLEAEYVYPLLKSSDLAKGTSGPPRRWVLVPQSYIGENTVHIKHRAPQTWAYLHKHQALFAKRKSSIYRNKPKFSIFGVGAYTFAPWKVAISGLYKTLKFVVVGPYQDKPVMLDDTCYFIPCLSQNEADFLAGLLNSAIAQEFFSSFIFWDAKRPITAQILNHVDVVLLAEALGVEQEIRKYVPGEPARQLSLLPL